MSSNHSFSLKIVAYIYTIFGVASILEIILALYEPRISINIGVFCLLIGIGLLRLSPLAYTWAKVYVYLIAVFLFIFIVLFWVQYPNINLLNANIETIPRFLVVIGWVIAIGITYWVHRILNKTEVKRLFNKRE